MPAPLLSMAPMSGSGYSGDTSLVEDVIHEEEIHTDDELRSPDPEPTASFDVYAAYKRHLRNEQVWSPCLPQSAVLQNPLCSWQLPSRRFWH